MFGVDSIGFPSVMVHWSSLIAHRSAWFPALFPASGTVVIVHRPSFILSIVHTFHRSSFVVHRSSLIVIVRRPSFIAHRASFILHSSSILGQRSAVIGHRSLVLDHGSLVIAHSSSFIVHGSSLGCDRPSNRCHLSSVIGHRSWFTKNRS